MSSMLRVNAAMFWRVLFRSWPQKGFTPKEESLRKKFDHNFDELYVDSNMLLEKPNNFQCISWEAYKLFGGFLVRKSDIAKMVYQKIIKNV